jgi:hypothetical protein
MKTTVVTATRVADENHVVHTINGGGGDYCRKPCAQCPWRVDQSGEFPPEAFRISANTAEDMATHTFACHMRGTEKPATCAGFLVRGAHDNFTVRIRRGRGEMLDVEDGGLLLHPSYVEMAVANGVPRKDPALAKCMPEARFPHLRLQTRRSRRPVPIERFYRPCSGETLERIKRWPGLIKKLTPEVYIWSSEWRMYWRKGGGYTYEKEEAGLWSREDAFESTRHCGPEKQIDFLTTDGS